MKKILNMMKSSLMNLPTPINISYWWNYGSLLGLFLIIQIISGFILSIHYCSNINLAFSSIIHIIQNVNNGWLIHNIHMNGATLFFICLYIHISRGIYYASFNLTHTWLVGSSIFLSSMSTAFLGYILPWGQMSFWGATVITNLMSSMPYIGNMVVNWIWGGFSINNATLNRFFSLHFILPFIILFLMMLHLYYLHLTGSSNPLGVNSNFNKISFHNYFTFKDLLTFILFSFIIYVISLQSPYMFSDPDNFTPANSMITPTHIQPEWYFLYAYAILRSIPNKLGGVMALLMSIFILFALPLQNSFISMPFTIMNQYMYWFLINIFIVLTWAGTQMIETPYIMISQIFSFMYFLTFIMIPVLNLLWYKTIFMNTY